MISGRMSAKSRRSITFKLIENFNPANCSFLCLNINMHTIAAMKGAKSLMLKTKRFTPIVA